MFFSFLIPLPFLFGAWIFRLVAHYDAHFVPLEKGVFQGILGDMKLLSRLVSCLIQVHP